MPLIVTELKYVMFALIKESDQLKISAMTARRKDVSEIHVTPVDGLLMDRLSVIARNRGMGGRRLGPYTKCI